jgi:hypothetical protein
MTVEVKGNFGANFGPFVYNYTADDNLINGLLERAQQKTPGSGNKELAGVIEDQRGYSSEDKKWFVEAFQPYISDYARKNCAFRGGEWSKGWTDKFELMSLWINFMKSGESNPVHHHSGQITWVIYLETPDLEKEREEYQGRSVGPGGICFHYGEPQFPEWASHTYGYVPKKGDMWIFPALLRHEVIPFKSEGTRISVSGNFFFKNPNEKSGIIETAIDQDAKHPRA